MNINLYNNVCEWSFHYTLCVLITIKLINNDTNINTKLCKATVTIGIIVGKWMLLFNNDYKIIKTIVYDLKTYFYDSKYFIA